MARPWTFAQRAGAGFVVSLLVALVLAGTSVVALLSMRTNHKARILELSRDVLDVKHLERTFNDKVVSGRGFALSGDAFFAQDMSVARERFINTYESLKRRLTQEPLATQLEAVSHAELEHEEAMQALIMEREDGVPPQRLAQIFDGHVADTRRRALESLRTLHQQAEARLSHGIHESLTTDRGALGLSLFAGSLGLAGATMLAWTLTRRLRPIQQEAEANAERFQLLVEGVRDQALFLLDARGRVESWNPGAERIMGYREAEILGQPSSVFYPPDAVAAGIPEKDLARARRDGRLHTEGWRVRKDGSRYLADTRITVLQDARGRPRGFAKVTRDITERRRAERTQQLLAEAGRLFHQLQDPDQTVAELTRIMVPEVADACLLYLMTASGDLWPRAIAHAVPEKEAVLWDSARRFPPPRDTHWGIWQVLRTGRSELKSDVSPETLSQGLVGPEHLSLVEQVGVRSYLGVPLRVGQQTRGVFVLLTSAPERRLTMADQVFVEEVAGRAALALDNARLWSEAQEAVELIGVAAHDLGNPLNTLQLLLRRLQRMELAGEQKARDGLGAALKQTQRLGQLLHNLLDLSRLSSGKRMLDAAPVDLSELVHEVTERFAEQAAEAGTRLEVSAAPGLVGRWDRLRLDRVVTNLLSNALKFGKGRPVEVRVEHAGMARARLAVRDYGVGIAPEAQRRIFERFERELSGGQHAGFGLGLYIVRQLVEAHGGTIRVESAPGEGATFIVELPLLLLGSERREPPASPLYS
ncbi:ATP-binding protein [Corallococcus macrosporus]|uniref:histidine kinase n=1 Tax=Corallococcus macrosporus DSM 14697 TaxID=1189310 RepID=A0A250JLH5_9BACT|nr:ATP-binding protein [Corallococcus macrosporus]ATB44498.1 histidine kinase [Corallococcus macrosporus DSM 14697]